MHAANVLKRRHQFAIDHIARTTYDRPLTIRLGTTLVEMVVAISILSIVLALAGMTFHLLMRSEKLVSQSFITERTISQLATDFRLDVHLAKSGTFASTEELAGRELELALAGETLVRYRIDKDRVMRFLVRDGAITAREVFRFPDCQLRFVPQNDAEPNLKSLIIDRPGPMITRNPQAPRPLRPLTIQAYLNRWQTPLAKPESNTDDATTEKTDQDGAQ